MMMMMGWQLNNIFMNGLIFLSISLQCFVLATIPSSAKYFTIHWNSSNPIFRIDNTDNIIDVNRNNLKFEYDQVNLICPVYVPGTSDDEMEKYIIYNVSKDEYETCRITNPNPRIIAVCDKPYKLMYFTITFRPFTPQPGGLEFLPGHDYYFISTSTSDDLHRRIGGRCTTHNMKIVFKVWGPTSSTTSSSTTSSATISRWWPVVTSSPKPSQPSSSSTSITTINNNNNNSQQQQNHQQHHQHQQQQPSTSIITTTTTQPTTTTTKKSKTYNKHPNEVVKSEELTLGGTSNAHYNFNKNNVNLLLVICAAFIVAISLVFQQQQWR